MINLNQLANLTLQPICTTTGNQIGWHATLNSKKRIAHAGGTSNSRDTAIRIALAEYIERITFNNVFNRTNIYKEFNLNEFPTTCGFAAGFDPQRTRFRAICEGLERWAWSKWIDQGYHIPQVTPASIELTELGHFFKSQFDQVHFFKKSFELQISPTEKMNLVIGIIIGEKDNGVFAGSRVTTVNDQLWEHGLIEAYRNFRNHSYYSKYPDQRDTKNIVALRSDFFANNKESAFAQIPGFLSSNKINPTPWPEPQLRLLKQAPTEIEGAYLWRCLMHDFIGWDKGAIERFVY